MMKTEKEVKEMIKEFEEQIKVADAMYDEDKISYEKYHDMIKSWQCAINTLYMVLGRTY